MASICLTGKPLGLTLFKAEIFTLETHTWKIGAARCLLTISTMTITHIARFTHCFVSDRTTSTTTSKISQKTSPPKLSLSYPIRPELLGPDHYDTSNLPSQVPID